MNETSRWLLCIIFPITSIAGIANLLRSEKPITRRAVFSVALNSGLCGVAIASLMLHQFGDEALTLILGVSTLAGLGGNYTIDVVLSLGAKALRSRSQQFIDDERSSK